MNNSKLNTEVTITASQEACITTLDIEAVRSYILASESAEKALNEKANREVKLVSKLFLHREVNYQAIAHAINSMYAEDEHLTLMIAKLSKKLKFKVPDTFNNFSNICKNRIFIF